MNWRKLIWEILQLGCLVSRDDGDEGKVYQAVETRQKRGLLCEKGGVESCTEFTQTKKWYICHSINFHSEMIATTVDEIRQGRSRLKIG